MQCWLLQVSSLKSIVCFELDHVLLRSQPDVQGPHAPAVELEDPVPTHLEDVLEVRSAWGALIIDFHRPPVGTGIATQEDSKIDLVFTHPAKWVCLHFRLNYFLHCGVGVHLHGHFAIILLSCLSLLDQRVAYLGFFSLHSN